MDRREEFKTCPETEMIIKLLPKTDQKVDNDPEIKVFRIKWGLSVGDFVCTNNGIGKVTNLENKSSYIRVDNEIVFRKDLKGEINEA